MDEQLQDKLNAILADPEQMSGIFQMARQLMGGGEAAAAEDEQSEEAAPGDGAGNVDGLLSLLGGNLGGRKSKNEALLAAMTPYLRPERRNKIQRAMKLAGMMRLAGNVMKEYGGDILGL